MDVNLLSKLLKALIIDNEHISLSGIGYFTTEPVPAFFSGDGKTIFPPSRKIHFKSDGRAESDMIWKFYSKEYDIEENTAKLEVETFMKQLLLTLLEKKSIELPGLGRLVCTNNGEYLFLNESDGGIFSSAFGFEPVTLRPSGKQTEDISQDESEMNNSPIPEITEAESRKAADKGENLSVPGTAGAEPDSTDKEIQPALKSIETDISGTHSEDSEKSQKKKLPLWAIILIIIGILLLIAVIFVLLSHTGLLDGLLYSDEELQLLKDKQFL